MLELLIDIRPILIDSYCVYVCRLTMRLEMDWNTKLNAICTARDPQSRSQRKQYADVECAYVLIIHADWLVMKTVRVA